MSNITVSIATGIIVAAGAMALVGCASLSQTEIDFGETCHAYASVTRFVPAGRYLVDVRGDGFNSDHLPGDLYVSLEHVESDHLAGQWLLVEDDLHQTSGLIIGSDRDNDPGPGDYRVKADGSYSGASACVRLTLTDKN